MATTRKHHAGQEATGRSGDEASASTGGRSHHGEAGHRGEAGHDGTGAAPATLPHLDLAGLGHRIEHTTSSLRRNLPPTERVLFYGGLGAAVVAGMVDLPVGVAIGAGVWVATHTRKGRHRTVEPGGHNGAGPDSAGR